MLEFGPHEDSLWVGKKQGKPVPALDNKPELAFSLEKYLETFTELSSTRTHVVVVKETEKKRLIQYVPDPIPYTEMEAWFRLRNIPRQDWSDFIYYIVGLDKVWLNHVRTKLDK